MRERKKNRKYYSNAIIKKNSRWLYILSLGQENKTGIKLTVQEETSNTGYGGTNYSWYI